MRDKVPSLDISMRNQGFVLRYKEGTTFDCPGDNTVSLEVNEHGPGLFEIFTGTGHSQADVDIVLECGWCTIRCQLQVYNLQADAHT